MVQESPLCSMHLGIITYYSGKQNIVIILKPLDLHVYYVSMHSTRTIMNHNGIHSRDKENYGTNCLKSAPR